MDSVEIPLLLGVFVMSASTTTNYAFLSPPTHPDDLGVLGSYRVLRELGRGGMGFVFQAEDTRLKRAVALKVMNEKIAATPYSRRRFIDEARSMAAVKHDNVATIYEVNEISGTPFMAMEMLKGGTLEAVTKQHKTLNYQQVIHYATQMARGLGAAHSQGIVHRDIKPANIWIEAGSDRVKILDFGLALAQVPVDRLAGRGTVVGTPQYLSPEQARSEPLDNRTDLYSLGVVLYEMCTGRLPFRAKNVPEQLILTLVHEATPVNQVNPEIPEPLAQLIARLMQKEPRMRPRTATELEKLLGEVAVQCEAKSDVALAINKLQAHLNLVKDKQPDPFATEPAVLAAPLFDDNLFAALPAVAVAPTLPAASPVAPLAKPSPTSSRPKPTAPAPTAKIALPSYWPWIAAGVCILLFLGVIQFVFISSSGSPHQASVVIQQPNSNGASKSPANNPKQNNAAPNNNPAPVRVPENDPAPSVNSSNKPASQSVDSAANNKPASQNNKGKRKGNNSGNRDKSDSLSNSGTPKESAATDSDKPVMNTLSEPEPTQTKPSDTNDPSSGAPIDDKKAVSVVGDPDKPVIKEHVSRNSSQGRGADTTVKNGGSSREQLGDTISIAVQTRGKVDVQHSYIRFDIQDLKKNSSKIGDVELRLVVPGDGAPAGSIVRVYGVPEQYPDNWSEVGARSLTWGNSISEAGLQSIPLLAEVTLTGREGSAPLRITDPRLSDFVRGVDEEFVTLILAGGSPGNKPLHFVSREGSVDQAPSLELDILEGEKKK